MKVKELIAELLTKEQDEEIIICERTFNDEGKDVRHTQYSIGDIEQWSHHPEESHHYTIFGGEFISG